jgi:carbamoyl-phosphate synthase large subunit
MGELTVFVTGAGALVGQGVLRALRMSGRPMRIITGDPDHRAAGHWLGDKAYRIPMAADPTFLDRVEEVIVRERVSVLLVGTDVELGIFGAARERLEAEYGIHVVVSPPHVVEIADDKWRTAKFLKESGFPYPRTALSTDRGAVEQLIDSVGFPLFAKPRRGARSVGVGVVERRAEIDRLCAGTTEYVLQELLPEGSGEFTAGCLVTGGRCGSVVVLRRDLRDGNTYRAYSEGQTGYEGRIAQIAERLGAYGPCNLQFRVTDGEPVVFEVNARFSGTTPIRGMFGYNEVSHLLNHLVDGVAIPPATVRQGVVLRVWSDIFVGADQFDEFSKSGRLQNPATEPFDFAISGDPAGNGRSS